MITEDQGAVIRLLSDPSTYGGAAVERIDTHSAVVFLAGTRAFKLKRAVWFDYLDFSTASQRRRFCDAEVALNRRTAPALYLGVRAVTRQENGALALDGPGEPVDWVIEMERFPQSALLDRIAVEHGLGLELIGALADRIASFHTHAEPRLDHGGHRAMAWVIEGNAVGFAEFGEQIFDRDLAERVTGRSRAELQRTGPRLDQRRADGFVRQCHGDLHLGNIVLLDGQPTLFDAIEFNDEVSCIDVHYDLAFLLMDLWHRQLPQHANILWNRYLAATADYGGAALLPLFLSCRAAVRAKTSATAARVQADEAHRRGLEQAARGYLRLADDLLVTAKPSLVAIGGFSGTGKSTLAFSLAPSLGAAPGAVVLRSDEFRKRDRGVDRLSRLGDDAYTRDMSERVYRELGECALQLLRDGRSVIVDAVHAHEAERQAIARVAAQASAPFSGLWLEAPEDRLIARVETRGPDASDARKDVVRAQIAGGSGEVRWHRVDASLPPERVLARAAALLPHPALPAPLLGRDA